MNCQFQNSQRLPGGLPLGENLILLFFIQHVTITHKCSLHTFSVSMFPSLSHFHLSSLTVREKCGGRGGGRGGKEKGGGEGGGEGEELAGMKAGDVKGWEQS